ncbi:hypothetical protein DUI87_18233 [Hirundo rustica rustica]|uniref:Uncharacterized protein n=1 Tax=Hirundo rustica rustica TaxID=333673 RepID=A0A3M0JVK0_HIRRU|nr:hypothetical protein DUI87_18233 [Hirundo rustica rustica]
MLRNDISKEDIKIITVEEKQLWIWNYSREENLSLQVSFRILIIYQSTEYLNSDYNGEFISSLSSLGWTAVSLKRLLHIAMLHAIQNAKMGESASDLENADVHLGMAVDTVIKQFVLKVVGIMELVWLLGFVAVQLDGSVEHVT